MTLTLILLLYVLAFGLTLTLVHWIDLALDDYGETDTALDDEESRR